MNQIETIIAQYCPAGVEFKKIGMLMTVARGASPRPIQDYITDSSDGIPWIKIGDVKSGSKYIFRTEEKITLTGSEKSRYLKKGSFVLSNSMSFGRPYILAIDGCIHDGWISLSNFERHLIPDFLYFMLGSERIQNIWKQKASSGTVSNLNANIVRETIIPIPPLPIQQEIVNILDKFTQLEAELEAELEARKVQYEYYRNELLNFADKEVEWITLGEVLLPKGYIRGPFGSALKKEYFHPSGIPVYEQQHAIYGHREFRYFIDVDLSQKLKRFYTKPKDLIISCSGTIGKISIINENDARGIINQALLILRLDINRMLPKFFKHYLENNSNLIVSSSGGAITNIEKREIIEKIKIPILPLSFQEQIVTNLDKFDTLVNDLSIGLPAEINARKKQYEYYRNKLLTFKELEA